MRCLKIGQSRHPANSERIVAGWAIISEGSAKRRLFRQIDTHDIFAPLIRLEQVGMIMSDENQIQDTIQVYFDGMYESSSEKTYAAFHPNAKITGYLDDGLHQMTVGDFASFVASQQPSAKEKDEPARIEILSLEIAGNTAVARVRDDYLGMTFMDALSFLKVDGKWSIYNKLFHVEGPSG
jgi:ASC-1-like (ASCH) protein